MIMELKIDGMAKGTRIITGDEAKKRRAVENRLASLLEGEGFNEIILPVIEKAEIYTDKAGDEILGEMYNFKDKGDRMLCLRPEGTATIQKIADKHYKTQKDVKFWYMTRCYRYERPQTGRYREFWQLGVEWINPSNPELSYDILKALSRALINHAGVKNFQIEASDGVERGFAYYNEGKGFEIKANELGAQKQICGGGAYKQGVGFAIGFDRLMLMENIK